MTTLTINPTKRANPETKPAAKASMPQVALVLAAAFLLGCIQTHGNPPITQATPAYSLVTQALPNATSTTPSLHSIKNFQTREDDAVRVTNPTSEVSDQNPAFLDENTLVFTRFSQGYNTGPAALMGRYLNNGSEFIILQDEAQNVNVNGNPFTPDKKQICYASDVEDSDEIWCLDLTSKTSKRITRHTEGTHFIEPSVSSDGQTIVFEEHANGETDTPGKIGVTDFNGNAKPLLDDAADNRLPAYNPRDSRILFQRNQGNDFRLFLREKNGKLTELKIPTEIGTDASWANQNTIVYSAGGKDLLDGTIPTYPKIYEYDLDTQTSLKLTNAGFEDGAPAVSSEGNTLAFESHINNDEKSPSRIWVKTLNRTPRK